MQVPGPRLGSAAAVPESGVTLQSRPWQELGSKTGDGRQTDAGRCMHNDRRRETWSNEGTVSHSFRSAAANIMKNKRKHKHKHKKKVSEKKRARQEIKRLRRAERRSGHLLQESQNDDDNVLNQSPVTRMTASDENRSVRRHKHKSHQKKARQLTISRFRQIDLSDGSEEEDAAALSSQPSIPIREEPKIPSSVSRSLRKQVNKLSQVFGSSLSFNADAQETENTDTS